MIDKKPMKNVRCFLSQIAHGKRFRIMHSWPYLVMEATAGLILLLAILCQSESGSDVVNAG